MWLLPPRLTPQLGGAQHSACAPRLMTAPSQSRPTTVFAMSGLAPIATVMLQCHDRSKSANKRHRSRDGGSLSRDRKLKESTPRLAPGRPQPPTVGFDNRAADREAHAHAVGLRRVEGFKETRQALRAQPRPGVPHRDAHALRLNTHGADV